MSRTKQFLDFSLRSAEADCDHNFYYRENCPKCYLVWQEEGVSLSFTSGEELLYHLSRCTEVDMKVNMLLAWAAGAHKLSGRSIAAHA